MVEENKSWSYDDIFKNLNDKRKINIKNESLFHSNPMVEAKEIINDNNYDYRGNRLIVCLLAVLLLWLSSLQMIIALINIYIPSPSFTSVKNSCEASYTIINQEKDLYSNCVNEVFDQCNNQYNISKKQESTRINELYNNNKYNYQQLLNNVNNCSYLLDLSKQSLNKWTSISTSQLIPYNYSCTKNQLTSLKQYIGDLTTSNTLSLYSNSLDYSYNQQNTISNIVDYTIELDRYNREYIRNKTEFIPSIDSLIINNISISLLDNINITNLNINLLNDELISCIGNSSITSCPLPKNLNELYESLKSDVNADILNSLHYLSYINEIINLLINNVESTNININNYFNSIEGATGIIEWISNHFNVLSSTLCGQSNPDWCNFELVDLMISIPQIYPAPQLTTMPDFMSLWQSIDSIIPDIKSNITIQFDSLYQHNIQLMNDLVDQINDININIFDDYNPPVYTHSNGNISQEIASSNSDSKIFRDNLDLLTNPSFNYIITNDNILVNHFNLTSLTTDSITSTYSFNWNNFDTTGLSIEFIILTITNLTFILTIFDVIYRIICSIILIRRYWSSSIVDMPPIDIRTQTTSTNNYSIMILSKSLNILSYIWFQLLIMITLIILIVWFISALFIAEYISYTSGCVYHTQDSTYLSKNLNSMAYNYASYDGNSAISVGLAKYNYMSVTDCSNERESSKSDLIDLVNNITSSNSSLRILVDRYNLIDDCIYLDELTSLYDEACCGYDNYLYEHNNTCLSTSLQCPIINNNIVYNPPTTYLSNSTCNDKWSQFTIYNSIYNCENIPTCQISCQGPRAAIIKSESKSCSCMSEWYFNTSILQIILGVFIYIIVNIARYFICNGIIRLFWRSLSPNLFQYQANCSEDGVIIIPDDKVSYRRLSNDTTEDSIEMTSKQSDGFIANDIIKTMIKQNITLYQLAGIRNIVIGLLMNLPWIILLMLLKTDVVYKPDKN